VSDPKEVGRLGLIKAVEYADDVLNERIIVGRYMRLAVERIQRDLINGHERGLVFDDDRAARALAMFSYLRHSKGQQWAGKQVDLAPWQCWGIAQVFGWVNIETGYRRFGTVYDEEARKNGKTTKLAGIGLLGLMKDDQGAPEVYSAATKRDQAKLLFKEACRMAMKSSALRRRLIITKNSIECPRNSGEFLALSADESTLDGLNPSVALIDELHAHKTSGVWDVIISALGARAEPLIWAITTAGFNQNGICYELRDYAIKVLEGAVDDDSFFAAIYTLDTEDKNNPDDPFDEANWIKANPNLNISVNLDYLRKQAKTALVMPSAYTNFLTKNLNIWVTAAILWCNMALWKQRGIDYTYEAFVAWVKVNDAKLYGGLDLANTSDLASIGLIAVASDGNWRTWGRHYLAEDRAKDPKQKNRNLYMTWERGGWLTLTPGNVCDYNFIKADIIKLHEEFLFEQINFDRWNSSQLVIDLIEEGLPMAEFGQGYVSMNAPMKEVERRYLSDDLMEHPNDPCLTWAMSNLVARKDPAGNIKPDKDKSSEKIDPAVALIMAAGAAMAGEEPEPEPEIILL